MGGRRMPRTRAVGADRAYEADATQIPLSWRVTKPKEEARVAPIVQSASKATVSIDPAAEVAEYYHDRAMAFRKRPKLARDDDAADERLF